MASILDLKNSKCIILIVTIMCEYLYDLELQNNTVVLLIWNVIFNPEHFPYCPLDGSSQ